MKIKSLSFVAKDDLPVAPQQESSDEIYEL